MPPVHLLVAELEAGLRAVTEVRREGDREVTVVLGWPRVSHPAIVRAWLGSESVVRPAQIAYSDSDQWIDQYAFKTLSHADTLADPEACGWALWAARYLARGAAPDEVQRAISTHERWRDDAECRRYADAVIDGARGLAA